MINRKIKVNGKLEDVSLLGFGCMRFPQKDGKIDRELSHKMIKLALDEGVNYIDTAYPYHDGESEEFVKEVLSTINREKVFLADKLPIWDCHKKEDVERIFHEQLEKCGVDYFDFYLIHAVNKNRIQQVKDLDLFNTLEKFKAEGKIRNIGFSFHDNLEAFKLWVELYDWDFVQIQLNYMDVEHQQGMEGYEILTKKDIPVIIMEPVKGGSLAHFNEKIEQKMKSYHPHQSIASWAFRWIGRLPNVKVVLSGMSTLEQVEDNLKTFNNFIPMNDEELKIVEEVRKDILNLSKVDCTSCNYCMPCPHGINIPANFRLYNGHAMYENESNSKWVINMLKSRKAFADNCIDCGECEPKCPQFIEIPKRLRDLEDYLKDQGLHD